MVKQQHRTSNSLYAIVQGDDCTYCGQTAETLDHAYPALADPTNAPDGMMLMVPSCNECNRLADARIHTTIEDRRRYVQGRLATKYRKLLATPEWTDSELAALSGRLRESIINSLEAQRRMALRVAYDPE